MKLCKDCIVSDYDVERNDETPFPSCTVLGGLMGSIAGLFSGAALLMIPAGLIAGAATDVVRCQLCGRDKDLYEFIEQKENKLGIKTYNRVPFRLYEDIESLDDQFTLEEPSKQYVWDEMEGRLMLIENTDDSPEINMLLDDFSPDSEASFEADAPLDVGSFDFDMGDFGDGGESGGLGSGEIGGDSGGSDFGGGSGGCV